MYYFNFKILANPCFVGKEVLLSSLIKVSELSVTKFPYNLVYIFGFIAIKNKPKKDNLKFIFYELNDGVVIETLFIILIDITYYFSGFIIN